MYLLCTIVFLQIMMIIVLKNLMPSTQFIQALKSIQFWVKPSIFQFLFFLPNRSLPYGLLRYPWMFWKSLTSTLFYSWYIFQGWCFISIRQLILFCTTSWVQNFEKVFEKFSTVSNGLWLRKGFARHHPVMIGDAKPLILHRRTQVKRPGTQLHNIGS